jgi:tripartite-type tricarboxylate transporter receptor subunit TctC
MRPMRRILFLLVLAAAFPAAAQYPSKPVRLVNPFTAGGPLDLMARILTERLTSSLGRPVIVENKPGAAGNVGAAEVARSAPDGHTVLLALFSMITSNPHLYDKLPFDPLKDFVPVVALARSDSVVVVHPSVPASTVRELVAYARANPGKVNYASAGKASPGHLTAEYFVRQAGVQLTHVPYKGNAEAIRSVLTGETQLFFTPTTGALAQISAGKLKALGVYLTDRVDELPNVASLESQGFHGFDQKSLPFWYGLVVPAGTPREAIDRLNAEVNKVLKDPQVVQRLATARIFPIGGTPEEFGALMRDGHAAWGKVIRETGVKGE